MHYKAFYNAVQIVKIRINIELLNKANEKIFLPDNEITIILKMKFMNTNKKKEIAGLIDKFIHGISCDALASLNTFASLASLHPFDTAR